MKLAELAAKLNEGPYAAAYDKPEIGFRARPTPIVRAVAEGEDRICLAVVGLPGAGDYAVTPVFVRGNACEVGEDVWLLEVDEKFPMQTLTFKRVKKPAVWEATHEEVGDHDGGWPAVDARLKERLATFTPPRDPELNKSFLFRRWGAWDGSNVVPAGVILCSPDGQMRVEAFPGFENQARKWTGPIHGGEEGLADITDRASRMESLTVPEHIKAESWEDAPARALYQLAKDWHQNTGRSCYGEI